MAQVAQLALALTPPYPVSEEQKLEWLRKGRIIHYPAERPVHLSVSSWDSIRTVRAGMLLSLFDRASRSCPVPIRLKHAIIEGDFRLRHLICSFEFSATEECAFTSEVDFSYTKFDGILDLSSASFAKRARLDFAHCGYDLRLNRAEFLDEASFVGISVGGRLNGRGACFSSRANFAGIHCSQIASFRSETPDQLDQGITTFTKDAAFLDAKFDGTIDFDGVQFAGKLDFSRCSVAGNAFFRPVHLLGSHHRMPVRFMGTVSFTDSVIGGSAVFEFAEFGKELRLNRARVGGGLYCKEALFGPGARAVFDNLQTGGPAFFDGAQFAAAVNFESVQIKGSLSFRGNVDKTLPTRFGDAASFKDCVIGGNASFGGANFWGRGEPSKRVAADFSRVRIGGSAFFGALGTAGQSLLQTRFMGKAYFDDLSVQGVCIFGGALFSGDLYFRRAQVGSSTYFAPIEIGEQMAHTYLAGASNFHREPIPREH